MDNSLKEGKLGSQVRNRGRERLIEREVRWVHVLERESKEESETGPAKNLRQWSWGQREEIKMRR